VRHTLQENEPNPAVNVTSLSKREHKQSIPARKARYRRGDLKPPFWAGTNSKILSFDKLANFGTMILRMAVVGAAAGQGWGAHHIHDDLGVWITSRNGYGCQPG
jgi:hypothetical protein